MAVTIHKLVEHGSEVALEPVEQKVPLKVVDDYAKLSMKIDELMKPVQPFIDKLEEMEKSILAQVDEVIAADAEIVLDGQKFQLELSKKGARTSVTDIKGIMKKLEGVKVGLFMELAKINIGDLKKYLPANTVEEFCTTEHVNKRRVTVKQKALAGKKK